MQPFQLENTGPRRTTLLFQMWTLLLLFDLLLSCSNFNSRSQGLKQFLHDFFWSKPSRCPFHRMLDFCLWATAAITSFRGAQPTPSTAILFFAIRLALVSKGKSWYGFVWNLVESKAKHDLSSFPSEKWNLGYLPTLFLDKPRMASTIIAGLSHRSLFFLRQSFLSKAFFVGFFTLHALLSFLSWSHQCSMAWSTKNDENSMHKGFSKIWPLVDCCFPLWNTIFWCKFPFWDNLSNWSTAKTKHLWSFFNALAATATLLSLLVHLPCRSKGYTVYGISVSTRETDQLTGSKHTEIESQNHDPKDGLNIECAQKAWHHGIDYPGWNQVEGNQSTNNT